MEILTNYKQISDKVQNIFGVEDENFCMRIVM